MRPLDYKLKSQNIILWYIDLWFCLGAPAQSFCKVQKKLILIGTLLHFSASFLALAVECNIVTNCHMNCSFSTWDLYCLISIFYCCNCHLWTYINRLLIKAILNCITFLCLYTCSINCGCGDSYLISLLLYTAQTVGLSTTSSSIYISSCYSSMFHSKDYCSGDDDYFGDYEYLNVKGMCLIFTISLQVHYHTYCDIIDTSSPEQEVNVQLLQSSRRFTTFHKKTQKYTLFNEALELILVNLVHIKASFGDWCQQEPSDILHPHTLTRNDRANVLCTIYYSCHLKTIYIKD